MKCEACGGEVDEDGVSLSPVEEEKSEETEVPPEVKERDFVVALKEKQ